MAGKRLSVLQAERDILVDRWMKNKTSDSAKILVKIMDLDEYIDKVLQEEKRQSRIKFH